METIPFLNLSAQISNIKGEILEAIQNVIDHNAFIGGEHVAQFEDAFAKALGVKHAIGVGNGTDAIHIALRCLGIGPGDKVITAANSFIGSSEPISMAGADVVFVDCDAETKNMDLNLLESMLAECRSEDLPKAIIPVHLYGQAMDMPRLMKIAHKYQLKVVEDCAQAHLAKCYDQCVGTYGDMACYSFYPGKNLGAMGDGGAVVTQSDKLADVARQFSNHGRSSKYAHEFEAVNSRLDGIQAAILKIKLRELPKWNLGRQKVAAKYKEVLRDIPQVICPKEQDGLECIYHLFVIETDQRDELRQHLSEDHIQTGIHYPIALPNLKAYQHLGFKEQDYPVSSGLEKRILSLPMFPELSEVSIERIGASIKRYFSKH